MIPRLDLSRTPSFLQHATRIAALALGLSTTLVTASWAGVDRPPAHPTRPITIVVAGPAGGATDGIARLVATRLSVTLDNDVVVDNKAGAGGVIGTKFVAQAKPDGHTLLLGHIATNAITPAVYSPHPTTRSRTSRPSASSAVPPACWSSRLTDRAP